MLENLDRIDWASLNHAYGSADDVPGWIRARASADPREADDAESALFSNIYHQGTVYDATAHAVPFLVELTMRHETHGRNGLLLLLASIAEGESYLEAHKDLAIFADERASADFPEKLAKEIAWRDRARAAVQQFADDFWTLMGDSSVQVAVPYLLSKLPSEKDRICARYPALFTSSPESLFEASLLMGLALAKCPVNDPPSFPSFLKSDFPLIRLVAALGVLVCEPQQSIVDRAIGIYFEALSQPDQFEPDPVQWFWGEGDLNILLLGCLAEFDQCAIDSFRETLPAILPALDEWTASDLAAASLHLGFDIGNLPQTRDQLTVLQRLLLEGLCRTTNIIYDDPLIGAIQHALGIFPSIKDLKDFMEKK